MRKISWVNKNQLLSKKAFEQNKKILSKKPCIVERNGEYLRGNAWVKEINMADILLFGDFFDKTKDLGGEINFIFVKV